MVEADRGELGLRQLVHRSKPSGVRQRRRVQEGLGRGKERRFDVVLDQARPVARDLAKGEVSLGTDEGFIVERPEGSQTTFPLLDEGFHEVESTDSSVGEGPTFPFASEGSDHERADDFGVAAGHLEQVRQGAAAGPSSQAPDHDDEGGPLEDSVERRFGSPGEEASYKGGPTRVAFGPGIRAEVDAAVELVKPLNLGVAVDRDRLQVANVPAGNLVSDPDPSATDGGQDEPNVLAETELVGPRFF